MGRDNMDPDSVLDKLLTQDTPYEQAEQPEIVKPEDLPPVSQELIEALEKRVPARCPGLGWSDRKIWFYAGMREMVEILKRENVKRVRRNKE